MEKVNRMENKGHRKKIQGNYKNDLPCIRKIIAHQEKLYNVVYRDGRWIRRYNVNKTKRRATNAQSKESSGSSKDKRV